MVEEIKIDPLPDDLLETISVIVSHEEKCEKEKDTDFIVTIDQCNNGNEYFVIEEYEEPQETIVHPSIGNTRADFLTRLKSVGQCFLCSDGGENLSTSLQKHFINTHLRHNLSLAGKLIVLCELGCKKAAHFHCPYPDCLFSCKHKNNLKLHYLESHDIKEALPIGDIQIEIPLENGDEMIPIKLEPEDPEEEAHIIDLGPNDIGTAFVEDDILNIKDEESKSAIDDVFLEHKTTVGTSDNKISIASTQQDFLQKLVPPSCYLCEHYKCFPRSRLVRHFSQIHLNHAIHFEDCIVALCKLQCSKFGYGHFHCPYPNCLFFVKTKSRLIVHYSTHFSNDGDAMPELPISAQISALPAAKNKSCSVQLPPPKKSFPFHGVQYFPHPSIRPTAFDLYDYLCLPFCFLCDGPGYYYTMKRLERHFKMAHMNRGVDCGSCYVVLCGLNCIPGKTRKHYHCPFCQPDDPKRCVATSRYRFWVHLEMHRREYFGKQNTVKSDSTGRDKYGNNADGQATLERDFRQSAEMDNVRTPQNWSVQYHGLPVINHPSINTNIEKVYEVVSLPNCYLCDDDKDHIYEKRLVSHISRVHVKPMFQMDNILVLLCKLNCSVKSYNRGHYHCFLCDFFALHKGRLEIHLQKHLTHMKKKSIMAEYHVPDVIQDHSVPDEWIQEDHRAEVREWERNFNAFTEDYSKSKTHNKVITERMKWLIYNHLRCGMDIEHRNLKYWVQFRHINVISCQQLALDNVLVMPLTKYNSNFVGSRNPPQLNNHELILTSNDPLSEFLDNFRLIPTCEEMFKLLYQMHIMDSNHPSSKIMFGNIRRRYLYLPRTIVDKFVELCPSCSHQVRDTTTALPVVTVENGDLVNLAGLQVTVVDMTEHPDGNYNYVVEVFDRCSRLTWLFPTERAVATDLAECLVRTVLSVTGLPCYIITNCGYEFLEKMLVEIDRRWFGACIDLIMNSREAAKRLGVHGSDELMELLQDMVISMPNSWAHALPRLQYRMNHTQRRNNDDLTAYELVLGRKRLSRPMEHKLPLTVEHPTNAAAAAPRNVLRHKPTHMHHESDDDSEEDDDYEGESS